MSKKIIIGIDPGLTGGLAANNGGVVGSTAMPISGGEVDTIALHALLMARPTEEWVVYLEECGLRAGLGAKAIAVAWHNFGKIKAVLELLNIPYVLVSPQAWKKRVLAGMDWKNMKVEIKSGKNKGKFRTVKNTQAPETYCRRMFPEAAQRVLEQPKKAHSGQFDAMCLMRFGEMEEGHK